MATRENKNLPVVSKGVLPALETDAETVRKLSADELPAPLAEACKRAGWTTLTPVQSLVIPYMEEGKDIMAQSRTGSGKTGCYLLPLLEKVDPNLKKPQVLVLTPTRELAAQVEREANTLFGSSGITACAIYGGVDYRRQIEALRRGAQVVIGTPGRIMDLLSRHTLNFKDLRVLIFDEADRMLSIGFYEDIKEIVDQLPKDRQTSLFSATYPPNVLQMGAEFMRDPQMLSLSRKEVHVPEVEHLYCQVKPMDKDRALVRLLETENPSSAIIFCNTKAQVHYIASLLKGLGYSADELSSDLTQKRREEVLNKIRKGEIKYLVATDVAARGIDIPDLSHVFLYEPPDNRENYIHRAGRTGRAGAAGVVISLVDLMQKLELERIARFYKIKLREMKQPGEEEVAKTMCERLNTLLETRLRSMSGLEKTRVDRYLPLARELMSSDEETESEKLSILAMLLDIYQRNWHNDLRENKNARQGVTARPARGGKRRATPAGKRKTARNYTSK